MSSAELSCRELVELITDYLDDAMAAAERRRFEAHLAICPGCRTYLEQIERTRAAIGHLPEEALTPEGERALLELFRELRPGPRRG